MLPDSWPYARERSHVGMPPTAAHAIQREQQHSGEQREQ